MACRLPGHGEGPNPREGEGWGRRRVTSRAGNQEATQHSAASIWRAKDRRRSLAHALADIGRRAPNASERREARVADCHDLPGMTTGSARWYVSQSSLSTRGNCRMQTSHAGDSFGGVFRRMMAYLAPQCGHEKRLFMGQSSLDFHTEANHPNAER